MKLFQHFNEYIVIINGDKFFQCREEEFLNLDPDNPHLSIEPEYEGFPNIFWTPQASYPEGCPDCSQYIAKIDDYLAQLPVVTMQISLDVHILTPGEEMRLTGTLKLPAGQLLPLSAQWTLRWQHESGKMTDGLLAYFGNGNVFETYVPKATMQAGRYELLNDLDGLEWQGVTYRVRLAEAVWFVFDHGDD